MTSPRTSDHQHRIAHLLGRQWRTIHCARCDCRTSGIEPRPDEPPMCWCCGRNDQVRPA